MPKEESYGGYKCHNCPLEVDHTIKTEDSSLAAVSMKVFLKEKQYEIHFELDDWTHPKGRCAIAEMVPGIVVPGNLPIVKLPTRKTLIELNYLPPITPANIKDKLSLYLTFS
jgi:hypothetical protein